MRITTNYHRRASSAQHPVFLFLYLHLSSDRLLSGGALSSVGGYEYKISVCQGSGPQGGCGLMGVNGLVDGFTAKVLDVDECGQSRYVQ